MVQIYQSCTAVWIYINTNTSIIIAATVSPFAIGQQMYFTKRIKGMALPHRRVQSVLDREFYAVYALCLQSAAAEMGAGSGRYI